MTALRRNSYTFREGLTMMAARAAGIDPDLAVEAGDKANATMNFIRNAMKAKSPKARAGHVTQAQQALRSISPHKHPELVNALQAKLLALQGRGGDTEIAHLTPGEVVIPRNLQTPAVMRTLAAEAARAGIDPRRYTVGHRANSMNPRTGAGEFADLCGGNIGECEVRLPSWARGFDGFDSRWPGIEVMKSLQPFGLPGAKTIYLDGGSARVDKFPRGSVGVGHDGDVSGIFNHPLTNLCSRFNADAAGLDCCQTKGPRVDPDLGSVPNQNVLDGMNANELELQAETYEYLSRVARVVSTLAEVVGVFKALRALGRGLEVIDAIEDRFPENPEAQDVADYLGGIAAAYRGELATREKSCGQSGLA